MTRELLDCVQDAQASAENDVEDLDLFVLIHDRFGQKEMKEAGCSPDAFVQMGMQLAYFRDIGGLCQTYESTSTRAFNDGRTETIRTCSIQSEAMIAAIEGGASELEKRQKLTEALMQHKKYSLMAVSGKGVDRHLFGLYVASVGVWKYSPAPSFLVNAMSRPFTLSTSQTPVGQCDGLVKAVKAGKLPEGASITNGGGFGPTDQDGYGVSYPFSGDKFISLHITSKKSSQSTNSARFARAIEKAFDELLRVKKPDVWEKVDKRCKDASDLKG
jgi:carnitine O-palmitoyltransferase 1